MALRRSKVVLSRRDIKTSSITKLCFHKDIFTYIQCDTYYSLYIAATVYGKGVYFARDAKYSVNYASADSSGMRQMYYASVLTGEYCIGNQNMLEPPPKNAQNPLVLFDSTVDNQANPTLYVVYLDTQVYPHYLITFQ